MAHSSEAIEQARRKGLEIKKEIDRKNRIYTLGTGKLQLDYSEEKLREAAALFDSILGWRDSAERKEEALKKAEAAHKERLYKDALNLIKSAETDSLEKAAECLRELGVYKDAQSRLRQLESTLADRASKEQGAAEEKKTAEDRKKLYEDRYSGLLAESDDVMARYAVLKRKLSIMKREKNAAIYFWLSFIGIVISFICYVLKDNGSDLLAVRCGLFIGPVVVVLVIVCGLSGLIKKMSLEKERKEVAEKSARIEAIPSLEEFIQNDPQSPEAIAVPEVLE